MITVKVLGAGCANCRRLAEIVERTAATLDADVEIEKVTDYDAILDYQVLNTPGLVINEQVVCSGRLPGTGEVTTWLWEAMMATATA